MIIINKYKFLTNPLYLYLLQHPEDIDTAAYSLSDKVGVSRQTILNHKTDVLKAIKENPLPIKNFYNECDNKYVRALKILFDLKPRTRQTKYMAAELLGVSYSTLTRYWSIALSEENVAIRGVYGIFDREKIIYVGSSENVRKRIKQHEWKIQEALEANSTSEVAKYLRKHPEAEITYKVFADGRDMSRADMLQLEKDLISFLQPCCNIMSK